ncbi:uncharacterized protein LOC136030406 [Artemia franciscana]|uniref:Uncharacterized protein n=1 Tax=Artemia franciscana TaxID=6661 RepID=A0AA88KT66_ARTSF|nr:hypothetical protein QYM36_015885 [Artemia franciscana]
MDSKWKNRVRLWLSQVADGIFALFVVSPLVVGFWRGVWQLLDNYLYPEDKDLSIFISAVIGSVIPVAFTVFRETLQKKCLKSKVIFYCVSRVYTSVFAFACVNNWRSLWTFLDVYTGINLTSIISSIIIGMVVLALMRCYRSIGAPPMFIATDSERGYFTFPTMFNVSVESSFAKALLDSMFSVCFCGYLVVAVWRGSFHLLDFILFPDAIEKSAWGSIVLGYSCSILMMTAQKPASLFFGEVSGLTRLVFFNLYNLFAFIGSVNTWRGLWNFYNVYILPENPFLSNMLTASVGFVILTFIGASHSILVRGVLRDVSETGENVAFFPYHYFLENFQGNEDTIQNEDKNGKAKGMKDESDHNTKCLNNHISSEVIVYRETVV